MARLEDIPQPRDAVVAAPCPAFDTQPFVSVAIVSSAALIRRGDKPFHFGSAECRFLPASVPAGELLMSHVSINFDRAGFQCDLNVVYSIDRLLELAAEGVIGGVAETHFTVMGSTDPVGMTATADQIAGLGRPLGEPENTSIQRRVLLAALVTGALPRAVRSGA